MNGMTKQREEPYVRPPRSKRTTRDYACGECGAQPGEPCRWPPEPGTGGGIIGPPPAFRVYHRDRERRFVRSVNRELSA